MKKNKEDLAKALRANLMRRKKAKAASAKGLATGDAGGDKAAANIKEKINKNPSGLLS